MSKKEQKEAQNKLFSLQRSLKGDEDDLVEDTTFTLQNVNDIDDFGINNIEDALCNDVDDLDYQHNIQSGAAAHGLLIFFNKQTSSLYRAKSRTDKTTASASFFKFLK